MSKFVPHTAETAPEASREGLAKARAHAPDLICLDITMPEESGVRMYRNLKGDPDLADIPVVVVTAVTVLAATRSPSGTS